MKKIYILFLVITSYTCTAQILLNGRLIHELPAKSSVDTGDLIIVANPTTGKPYKARKNQVVAGANGVTDGDKGDITVTGSGGVFTIDGSSVQNGKLAMMGDNTFKGNLSGTTASPQDLTASQVISALGINLKMAYADTASLSNRINAKQNTLVSGTNIKSVNGNSLIGSGDVTITSSVAWGNITGSNIMLQTDLRDSFEHRIAAGTTGQYWRGDKTWQTLNKAAVGLSAVDNTADVDKPISNATNAALAGKQAQLVSGTNIKTINFQDLLGSGNITISGTDTTYLSNRINTKLTATVTSPSTNEVIKYNGSSWVNGLVSLNDLSDVIITSADTGQILKYNGSNWVNTFDSYQLDSLGDGSTINWNFNGNPAKVIITATRTLNVTIAGSGVNYSTLEVVHTNANTVLNLPGTSNQVTWSTGAGETTLLNMYHNGTSFIWYN